MDGIGWLIKNVLDSQGIKINPLEITQAIETAKVLIPKIAEKFDDIQRSQKLIENRLAMLLSLHNMPTVAEIEGKGMYAVTVPVPQTRSQNE